MRARHVRVNAGFPLPRDSTGQPSGRAVPYHRVMNRIRSEPESTVARDYWALTLTLACGDPEAAGAVDAVANFLWEAGATGVVEDGEGPAARLRAFFPPGSDPAMLRDRLAGYLDELRALALPVGAAAI